MVTDELRSDVEGIETNPALFEETNFERRQQAIDTIEFNVIDRIEGLLLTVNPPRDLVPLKQYAVEVRRQLEAVDDALFRRLRAEIRMGGCTGAALKGLIDEYLGRDSSGGRGQDAIGYDSLDVFVNGLLRIEAVPSETLAREPGMVYYQQTPVRIIFELVERARLTRGDVFYDLGAGLGQVPILVNLLSGVTAKGIEFEPAYCNDASARAAALNLSRVAFINADARDADFSDGTVFFMYTPFEGEMLQDVLDKLREVSQRRRITLFTYGPCTPHVAQQSWLECLGQPCDHIYKLGVFTSRSPIGGPSHDSST